jgi:hypothetical protein
VFTDDDLQKLAKLDAKDKKTKGDAPD